MWGACPAHAADRAQGLFETSTTAGCGARGRGRPRAASVPPRSVRARALPSPAACAPSRRGTRLLNRVAVDPERHVVEEHAAVHLRHVDAALDAVGERVERADQIAPIDAQVEREVVAGAGRNAHERQPVRGAAAATTASDPSPPAMPSASAPPCHGVHDQRCEASPGAVTHIDASLARPLHKAGARRLAATRPRVDEQHRPSRPFRSVPTGTIIATDAGGASWRGSCGGWVVAEHENVGSASQPPRRTARRRSPPARRTTRPRPRRGA